MKFAQILAVVTISLFATAFAANWVVLVAGSNGYWNYRHQSDVAHAYQLAKAGGIPAERIITMVYNDIAKDSSNPYPGSVYNRPTPAGTPGFDVWKNLQADYTGNAVTPQNFLAVISGNQAALTNTNANKVVQSGPDDNIFIYFSDHGAPGLIAFPNSNLLVKDLQTTLNAMSQRQAFKKLVFYLEACESGSMFAGWLPSNQGIYATTAANPDESSWGFYCSPDDKVNGRSIGSCLGDEYSIAWLESVDKLGYNQTLADNYQYVKTTTKKSHVMQYGDLSFASDTLGDYLTEKGAVVRRSVESGLPVHANFAARRAAASEGAAVDSRDIKLAYHYNRYAKAQTGERKMTAQERFDEGVELLKELQHRLNEDLKYAELAKAVVGEERATLMHTAELPKDAYLCGRCCEDAIAVAESSVCGGFSDYSLKYVRTINNLCMRSTGAPGQVAAALRHICANPTKVV